MKALDRVTDLLLQFSTARQFQVQRPTTGVANLDQVIFHPNGLIAGAVPLACPDAEFGAPMNVEATCQTHGLDPTTLQVKHEDCAFLTHWHSIPTLERG